MLCVCVCVCVRACVRAHTHMLFVSAPRTVELSRLRHRQDIRRKVHLRVTSLAANQKKVRHSFKKSHKIIHSKSIGRKLLQSPRNLPMKRFALKLAVHYCKRRNFRREIHFVAFEYLKKKYEIIFHAKFSSTWFAGLSIFSSCFYSFWSCREYEIKFHANGFERKSNDFQWMNAGDGAQYSPGSEVERVTT